MSILIILGYVLGVINLVRFWKTNQLWWLVYAVVQIACSGALLALHGMAV